MKITLFDLETAPLISFNWGVYEQNALRVVQAGYLLCFSYKTLGEKVIHNYSLPDFKSYKKDKADDLELVKKLWEVMNESDVLVAHNGDDFDVKMAKAYFARHKLPPPQPFKTVDTKKVAKGLFRFHSNKLDDLGAYLGLGRKMHTGGFELWEEVMRGDKSAWKHMIDYCNQDIALLEKVYLKLRPWMANHPNWGLYEERTCCPNCGARKLQERGYRLTRIGKYHRYQCQSCGAWSSGERDVTFKATIK